MIVLRLFWLLTIVLLATRRSTRSTNTMPTDTIFEDTPADNGTGDVVNSDENPTVHQLPPDENVGVSLNYALAYQPDGQRALRMWANGRYLDVSAAQAHQFAILLKPAAADLGDIRQDIGAES